MGKFNQFILPFGAFFKGEYEEYDEETGIYGNPIVVKYKQNQDGVQGVSSGGKRTTMTQMSQGKEVYKKSVTIRVYDNHPYKPFDRFKLVGENTNYIIKDVIEDYTSTNSIANMAFTRRNSNKAYVLSMGER
jgi:hypothetical protein